MIKMSQIPVQLGTTNWDENLQYNAGEDVVFNGITYTASRPSLGRQPNTSPESWINPRGVILAEAGQTNVVLTRISTGISNQSNPCVSILNSPDGATQNWIVTCFVDTPFGGSLAISFSTALANSVYVTFSIELYPPTPFQYRPSLSTYDGPIVTTFNGTIPPNTQDAILGTYTILGNFDSTYTNARLPYFVWSFKMDKLAINGFDNNNNITFKINKVVVSVTTNIASYSFQTSGNNNFLPPPAWSKFENYVFGDLVCYPDTTRAFRCIQNTFATITGTSEVPITDKIHWVEVEAPSYLQNLTQYNSSPLNVYISSLVPVGLLSAGNTISFTCDNLSPTQVITNPEIRVSQFVYDKVYS